VDEVTIHDDFLVSCNIQQTSVRVIVMYLLLRNKFPPSSVYIPLAVIGTPSPMSVLTQSTLYSFAISSMYLTGDYGVVANRQIEND
jgi:hypothetical protein